MARPPRDGQLDTAAVSRLQTVVAQWQQASPPSLGELLSMRRLVASAWLQAGDEDLKGQYSGGLGAAARGLLKWGATHLPRDREDVALTEQAAELLQGGLRSASGLRGLLAAMVLCGPEQFDLEPDLSAVPEWLVSRYLEFMQRPPQFFEYQGHAERFADHLERWLDHLLVLAGDDSASAERRQVLIHCAQMLNMIPVYFDRRSPKGLFQKRGKLLEAALRADGYQLDYVPAPRSSSSKLIRLGVLNSDFSPLPETYATLPIFEHLDRSRFHVTLFSLRATSHPLEQYCQKRADAYVQLPTSLREQARALRDADLDILFFGTNLTAVTSEVVILAVHRLARAQATSICSPLTTGLPNVDWFITGTLTEPDDSAAEAYIERLLKVDGSGICFNYAQRPPGSGVRYERVKLGIPSDAKVFISGANFFKLGPEVRSTWTRILARVPDSRLILYPLGPAWNQTYPLASLMRSMHELMVAQGVDPRRLTLLRPMPSPTDILQTLGIADVYLDSFPYSGATSLLDPLEARLPPVVMSGSALRFSQGSALMREANLGDLIALDEESYVRRAVELATNVDLREKTRLRIDAAMRERPPFLDPKTFSARAATAFERML